MLLYFLSIESKQSKLQLQFFKIVENSNVKFMQIEIAVKQIWFATQSWCLLFICILNTKFDIAILFISKVIDL